MRPRFTYAKTIGRRFYNETCKNLPYPINLMHLISILKIGIIDTNIYGEDGFIMHIKEKNKYKIVIDYSVRSLRKRFTLAHEIGHIILRHFEQFNIDKLSDKEKAILDKEADVFAGELLMPYTKIKSINCELQSMCKLFDVTSDAMKTRLDFLGIVPYEKSDPIYFTFPDVQRVCEDENDIALRAIHERWLDVD